MGHEQQSTSEVCKHHWLLDSPVNGISHGSCKACGAERDFRPENERGPSKYKDKNSGNPDDDPKIDPFLEKIINYAISGLTDVEIAKLMGYKTLIGYRKARGTLLRHENVWQNNDFGMCMTIASASARSLLEIPIELPERFPASVGDVDQRILDIIEGGKNPEPYIESLSGSDMDYVSNAVKHVGARNKFEAMYIWPKVKFLSREVVPNTQQSS